MARRSTIPDWKQIHNGWPYIDYNYNAPPLLRVDIIRNVDERIQNIPINAERDAIVVIVALQSRLNGTQKRMNSIPLECADSTVARDVDRRKYLNSKFDLHTLPYNLNLDLLCFCYVLPTEPNCVDQSEFVGGLGWEDSTTMVLINLTLFFHHSATISHR